jgi:hypothetical protein
MSILKITPYQQETAEMRARGLTFDSTCQRIKEIDPDLDVYEMKLVRVFRGQQSETNARIEKIWKRIKRETPVLIDLSLARQSQNDNHIIRECQPLSDPDQRTPQNAGNVPAGFTPAGTTGDFL